MQIFFNTFWIVLIPMCSPIIQPYQAAGQNANVKTNENERIQQRTQRCRQRRRRRRRLRRRQAKEWAASQVLDGIALCRIASQELSARPKILYVHTYSPSRTVPHTLTQRCVAIKEMPHHCDNTFAPLARAGVGPKARAHRSPASLLPSSLSSSAVFVLSVAHGHIPHKADTETEHWSRSWS